MRRDETRHDESAVDRPEGSRHPGRAAWDSLFDNLGIAIGFSAWLIWVLLLRPVGKVLYCVADLIGRLGRRGRHGAAGRRY
jgi:hypothetical protein